MILSVLRSLDISVDWDLAVRAAAQRVVAEVADIVVREESPGDMTAMVRSALRVSESDGVPELVSRELVDPVSGVSAQSYGLTVARREGWARGLEAVERVTARATSQETAAAVAAGLRALLAEAAAAEGVSISRMRASLEAARPVVQQLESSLRDACDVEILRRDSLRESVASDGRGGAADEGPRSTVWRLGRSAVRVLGGPSLTLAEVEAIDVAVSVAYLQLAAAALQLLGTYLVGDIAVLTQSIAVSSDARDGALRNAETLENSATNVAPYSTLPLTGPAVSQALARAVFDSGQDLAERAVARWAEAFGWAGGIAALVDVALTPHAFDALADAAERRIREAVSVWTAADLLAEVVAVAPSLRLRVLHTLRGLADMSFIGPEFLRNGFQHTVGHLCVATPARQDSVTLLTGLLEDAIPSVRFTVDSAPDPDTISVILEVDGIAIEELAVIKAGASLNDPRFETFVDAEIDSGVAQAIHARRRKEAR